MHAYVRHGLPGQWDVASLVSFSSFSFFKIKVVEKHITAFVIRSIRKELQLLKSDPTEKWANTLRREIKTQTKRNIWVISLCPFSKGQLALSTQAKGWSPHSRTQFKIWAILHSVPHWQSSSLLLLIYNLIPPMVLKTREEIFPNKNHYLYSWSFHLVRKISRKKMFG